MLPCPKCREYMFDRKTNGVVVDLCSGCEGVWLDAGELATLAGTVLDVPKDNPKSRITNLHCPKCYGELLERPYSGDSKVLVDICGRCDGVFLDKGELHQIRKFESKVEESFTPVVRENNRRRARRSEALSAIYHTENPVAKHATVDRARFIRNVYNLLIVTLVVTAIGSLVGMKDGLALRYFWPVLIAEIIVFLITLGVRRVPVVGVVALLTYTFLSGFTIAAVLMRYISIGHGDVIWQAAALTGVIFTGLSVYVHVTKKDFSWMGGMLFAGLIALIVSGIFLIFFGGDFSMFIWSVISALIFSGFILYDTSRIILKYDTEEVVSAVIDLYLDIINLFLDLLRILSYMRR